MQREPRDRHRSQGKLLTSYWVPEQWVTLQGTFHFWDEESSVVLQVCGQGNKGLCPDGDAGWPSQEGANLGISAELGSDPATRQET